MDAKGEHRKQRRGGRSEPFGVPSPRQGTEATAFTGNGPDIAFLSPEFGAKLDEIGEPLPVKVSELSLDPGLKQLALKLWRDFQGGRASVEKSIEAAGLDKEDLWKPGITETLSTSSNADEIARFRQKLQFRADFLEAALEETLLQLESLAQYGTGAGDVGWGTGDGGERQPDDSPDR